jgi:nitroimidazol reductase NimA-like FMN-containing flavoprotein (pyridoxamine 5'-phosphate oxidase superfamily)
MRLGIAESSRYGRLAVLIEELSRQSCLDLLSHMRLGRLACAQGTQPYVVPFYFACDNNCIYGFSTVGKKIEWMRANPQVCVEADEVVSPQDWRSVIVLGRYEELPDTPEWTIERVTALSLLRRHAMWWEPAYAKTAIHGRVSSLEPVFYRIHIDAITGRRATRESSPQPGLSATSSEGWLQGILRRLHGEIE